MFVKIVGGVLVVVFIVMVVFVLVVVGVNRNSLGDYNFYGREYDR